MTDMAVDPGQEKRIAKLLAQGKNVYQPLYNYPLDQPVAPLRDCADRCAAVAAALGPGLDGLRLWDAGCSLGYNTLYFVARGMTGLGTDIDARNIAICNEIKRFTPGSATFRQEELTLDAVRDLPEGSFDTAFFFSILHHLIEVRGLSHVQQMMQALLERIPVLFVELALRTETPPPGYDWARHLPADELEILATCPRHEVTLLGRFETHVCEVPRPLYRISRRAEAGCRRRPHMKDRRMILPPR